MLERLETLWRSSIGKSGVIVLLFGLVVKALDWWGPVDILRSFVSHLPLRIADVAMLLLTMFLLTTAGQLCVFGVGVLLILWALRFPKKVSAPPSSTVATATTVVETQPRERLRALKADCLQLSNDIIQFIDHRQNEAPTLPYVRDLQNLALHNQKRSEHDRQTVESYQRRFARRLDLISKRLESAGYLSGTVSAYAIQPPVKPEDIENIGAELRMIGDGIP